MSGSNLIYNTLPYIYTIGGVLTLLVSREGGGNISGLLLISAAMMIFHMRLEYRTRRAEMAEEHLEATRRTLVTLRTANSTF